MFAPDEELLLMERWAKKLQVTLGIKSGVMSVSTINAKSEQSIKMLNNAGQVVGADWQNVNSKKCLMLTIQRPNTVDVPLHLFHLCMANIFLSHADSLVGYKYITGVLNEDEQEDVWLHPKWDSEKKCVHYYRILPKRLSEPRSRIINVLNSLGQ